MRNGMMWDDMESRNKDVVYSTEINKTLTCVPMIIGGEFSIVRTLVIE
jgi:hypothetical protein